jgi:hypothetical protein
MQRRVLDVNDLRVESFDLETLPRNETAAPELLHTRWPKDCAETLPQFC